MKNSAISWTDHTFNPWWGCEKVSPACTHCYAERGAKRYGFSVWGAGSERRFFGDRHWAEPIKWNREAEKLGVRKRVFCASMADVFEARLDLNQWRIRLWDLISKTPNLDWLLLTKRPENINVFLPWSYRFQNIWLGTTAENQHWWDKRIPLLLQADCILRFVSVEPLLGPIKPKPEQLRRLDWILVGGESGPGARLMKPIWVNSLRGDCAEADVPFHFKQLGNALARELGCVSNKGSDPQEWLKDFRIQMFPVVKLPG